MTDPSTPPPRRKSLAEQSFGDMLRSVAVLLLIIGVLWAVSTVVSAEDEAAPVRAVDYTAQLGTARARAAYPVLAPEGLSPGWVPTSVDLDTTGGTVRWHLGFLTPGREYVGLEQGDADPQDLRRRYVGDLRPVGALPVAGRVWRVYRGETDSALVRSDGPVVTIVVGTAPVGVLRTFAGSLR